VGGAAVEKRLVISMMVVSPDSGEQDGEHSLDGLIEVMLWRPAYRSGGLRLLYQGGHQSHRP
jgi:hypothetical protein